VGDDKPLHGSGDGELLGDDVEEVLAQTFVDLRHHAGEGDGGVEVVVREFVSRTACPCGGVRPRLGPTAAHLAGAVPSRPTHG
jgi:hypothetical protein